MGPAYVGICLPSTCEATKLENFLNEKLNETLGGLFKPMGSKIVDEIKDAVYTSEPRPFTTGDIVTMYIAHQSHYREVPRWEIFLEQELRFGWIWTGGIT